MPSKQASVSESIPQVELRIIATGAKATDWQLAPLEFSTSKRLDFLGLQILVGAKARNTG